LDIRPFKRFLERAFERRFDQHPLAGDVKITRFGRFHSKSQVNRRRLEERFERRVCLRLRIDIRRGTADQDRVDAVRLLQSVLKPTQRNVGVPRQSLIRPQCETPHSLGGNDLAHREAIAGNGLGLAPQRRRGRNRRNSRQPQNHRVARLNAELLGQRCVDHDLAPLRLPLRTAMPQLPEFFPRTHEVHSIHPSALFGTRVLQAGLQQDCRKGVGEEVLELGPAGQFAGQVGAEEPIGDQRFVDASQALERQIPQAPAHRIAHDQRAGEHGGGGRHARAHGGMHPPVIDERSNDEPYQ